MLMLQKCSYLATHCNTEMSIIIYQYLLSISLKVSSSWEETALIFIFSLMISSSRSSILRWSLLMFISAYSDLDSACFRRMLICLICSWYFSSLFLAFSSEISSCFWFSPIVWSSSSMTTTLDSALFTLSSARFNSSSIMARERAKLSYFISLSVPILLAFLILLSNSSITTSLFIVLFSHPLIPFTILSASLDMLASLWTVVASFSVLILTSSSIRTHLRAAAFTSSSLSLNSFSASSILEADCCSFSRVSSMRVSCF